MNAVALVGRLCADPELKYTPSGTALCTLRIAVARRFKSESGERESDFFDVVAWKQSAEFAAKYLTKGGLISVEGRLQSRSWTAQDGQKRSKVEIVVENIQGLSKAAEGAKKPAEEVPAEDSSDYDPFAEE